MKSTKITIRFNLNKEPDRRAYEFLQKAEASYSKAVISVLNAYLDSQEKNQAEDTFLKRVIDAIRQEMRMVAPLAGLAQLLQQPISQAESTLNAEDEEAMEAFLAACDGGF